MKLKIFKTKKEASLAASKTAAMILKKAIKSKGQANFIAATGKSQFEFLKDLIKYTNIDWRKTTMFHLDEYLRLSATHQASFQRYLKERLIDKVHPGKVHLIKGTAKNPQQECQRLNKLIAKKEIDVAFLGVGENGHLAFNDPPADFTTNEPFIMVKLNQTNRQQQVKEGWFAKISDVPKAAISMSIKQIMKSENIICLAFGERKSKIVRDCFTKKVSKLYPASILQKHPKADIYLDKKASALLKK